ncbi:hypothetical protein T492DRAFT_1147042, partial [Pavlovales sp. CCMP2436]
MSCYSNVAELLAVTPRVTRNMRVGVAELARHLCSTEDGLCMTASAVAALAAQSVASLGDAKFIELNGLFFVITHAFVRRELFLIDPDLLAASLHGDPAADDAIRAAVETHLADGGSRLAAQLVGESHCSALLVCAPSGDFSDGRAFHLDSLSRQGAAYHAAIAGRTDAHLRRVLAGPRGESRLASLLVDLAPLKRLAVAQQTPNRHDCVVATLVNIYMLPASSKIDAILLALAKPTATEYARARQFFAELARDAQPALDQAIAAHATVGDWPLLRAVHVAAELCEELHGGEHAVPTAALGCAEDERDAAVRKLDAGRALLAESRAAARSDAKVAQKRARNLPNHALRTRAYSEPLVPPEPTVEPAAAEPATDPAALATTEPLAPPEPTVEPAARAPPEPAALATTEPAALATPEPVVEPAAFVTTEPAALAPPEPAAKLTALAPPTLATARTGDGADGGADDSVANDGADDGAVDGADGAGDGADGAGDSIDSASADMRMDLRAISGVPRTDLLKVYAALDVGGTDGARLSLEQVRQVLSVQPMVAVSASASGDDDADLPTGAMEARARLVVDVLLARGWARTEPRGDVEWTHVWPTTDGEWHAQGMRTLNAVQNLAVTRIVAELRDANGWCERLRRAEVIKPAWVRATRLRTALCARLSHRESCAWGQVNRNWPRALLDAPCAFGKTVTAMKIIAALHKAEREAGRDLGVVVIFEPLLALVRQTRDEWHTWLTRPGGVDGLRADDVKALVLCSDTSLVRPSKRTPSVQQQQEEEEEEDGEALEADLLRTGCAEWAPLTSGTQARDDVFKFLARPELESADVGKLRVMFVTYASVEVLLQFNGQHEAYPSVVAWPQPPIGLVVFDEAHTTAVHTKRGAMGEEKLVNPLYGRALDDIDLPCERRLFMTATPKLTRVNEYKGDAGTSRLCSMDAFELYGGKSSGNSVHGARFSLPFGHAVALGLVVDYKIFAMFVDPEALPASCSRVSALRSLVADDCLQFELEGESRCARVIELAKACCIEWMVLEHKLGVQLAVGGDPLHLLSLLLSSQYHKAGADGADVGLEKDGAVGMCALLKAKAVVHILVDCMRALPQLEIDGEDYSRILTLSSATSAAKRDAKLRAFTAARHGEVALTNPRSVGTSFNATDVDAIVITDAVASVVDIVQMTGRAGRQDWPRTGDDLNVRSLRRLKVCNVILPIFVSDEVAIEVMEMAAQMRAGRALQARRRQAIAQSDTRLRYLLSTAANVVRVNGVLRQLHTELDLRAISEHFEDYVRDNEAMFLMDDIKQGHRIMVHGKDVNFNAFISLEHSVPECYRAEFDELAKAAQWHLIPRFVRDVERIEYWHAKIPSGKINQGMKIPILRRDGSVLLTADGTVKQWGAGSFIQSHSAIGNMLKIGRERPDLLTRFEQAKA